MPERPNIGYLLNKPPEEIIRWFKDKDYKISWNWRDVMKETHLRAFTVAKAMNLNVLESIRGEVESALEEGTTLRQLQKDLQPRLKKLGWWGKQEVVDSTTGEVIDVQLGSPWRLKTIYRTNMQTSYMRGRYLTQKRSAEARPWWLYDAVNDSRTRPAHAAHDNTIKRHDDPFWDTHYPPNGWGCRCVVRTYTKKGLDQRNLAPTKDPIKPFASEGWNYNPGADPWRGLTPTPPRSLTGLYDALPDQLPQIIKGDIEDLPMKPFDPDRVLPHSKTNKLSKKEYAEAFLSEFDTTIGRPVVYTDKAGSPLTINEGLLKDRNGEWKVTKQGREQYLRFLADAIKDPAEIWLTWVDKGGKRVLSRRYIALFEDPKGQAKGYAAFDWVAGGWKGITTFSPNTLDYLDRQRTGYQIYKKAAS